MKRLLKILATLVTICCIIAGFIFYGTFISVKRVNIHNVKVYSEKIPDECNNMKIALISDLHYNGFMNKERFSSMIETINNAKPDIILFAGDVYDYPKQNPPSDEIRQELIELLKKLEAPYGKFAVLGESDHESTLVQDTLYNLFYYADFELLDNSSILLHKDGSKTINLVGIDSSIGGRVNIEKAMSGIDVNNFTMVLTHAPDIVTTLPLNDIDLILAGHSHGGQVYLPLFGALFSKEGATKFVRGEYTLKQANAESKLIITNGLGTSDMDIRLFAPPQCTMIRLTNQP